MQYIHNQSNISEAFDFEQLDANDIISQPSNFAIYSITPYIVSLLTEFLSATEIKCLNPVKGITEFYPDIIPGMPAAVVKSNVVLYTGFSCSRGDYYIQLEDIKCFNVFKTCGTIVSDEEILDKLRLEFNHIFMSPTLQRQYLDAYKVYQRITENISIDTIIKLYNAYIPSKYRFSTTFILSHDCISYKVGYNNNDIMCECVPNLPEEYLDPDDTASVIIGLTGANIPDICKTSYNTITEAFDFNEVDDMVSDTPYNTDDARRLYADGLDIRPVIPEYFNIKPLSGTSVYRLKELSYYPALIKPMINYCSRATDTINNLVHEKWIHILGEYYDAYVYLCDNPEATIDELKSLYPEPENRTVAEVIRTNLQIVLYGFHQIFDVAPEACDVVPIIIKGCSCGNMLNTAMDGYIGTYTMALDDIYISPDCAVYYFKNLKNYVNKNLVPEKGDYIVCVGLTGYNIPECCKKNHKKPISEAFDFNDVEDSLSDSPYDSMYVKKVYSGTLDIRPVLPAVFNLKDITGATVYRPEELGGFPALIKPMGTAHSTISKAIDSIARTNNGWFCVLGLYYQAHEYLNNHPDATLEELINLYSSLQFKGMYIAAGFKSDLENILDTYKKITAITNGDYEFILNILKEYSCNVDLPENKHQHIRAIRRLYISPDCSIYYFYADGYSTRADLRNGKYYLMCIGLTGHNIPEYCHTQPKKKVSRVKEAHEVTVLKRMMAKANISAASIADVEYGIFSDGRPYCVITGEKYYKSSGSCKMANAAKDKIRYNMASIYSRGMDQEITDDTRRPIAKYIDEKGYQFYEENIRYNVIYSVTAETDETVCIIITTLYDLHQSVMNFNEELRLRRKKPIQESFDFNSVLDDDTDDTASMTYNSLSNKLFIYEASVIPILQDEMKIPSLRGWNLLNEPAHGWGIPYYWTQVHNINSSKGNKIWNTFISTGGINIQDYGIECVFDLYKDPSLNLSDWKEQFMKNPENDRDYPTMNAEDFKKCQDFVNIIPFQTFNKMFNECCKNMDYYRNKGRHIYFVINREGSAWLCLTYMSEYSVSWRCIVGLTGINTPSKCFLKDKAPEKSNGDTPEAKACRKFLNATAVAKIPMKTLQGEYVQLSDKRMAYVHRSQYTRTCSRISLESTEYCSLFKSGSYGYRLSMDQYTRYIPAEIMKLIQDKTYRIYDFKVSFYIKGVGHQYGDMTNPTAFKMTLMNDTEMATYIFPSIPDAYDSKGNVLIDKFNS